MEVLNCIYECDFKGFSYGFRPKRSAHQALQSLQTVLQKGVPTALGRMLQQKPFLVASHEASSA